MNALKNDLWRLQTLHDLMADCRRVGNPIGVAHCCIQLGVFWAERDGERSRVYFAQALDHRSGPDDERKDRKNE